MITREDVLGVAKDLNINPTEKQILFVIRYYDIQAEEDPTGYWVLWVEALLYDYDADFDEEDTDKEIEYVFEYLKKEYINSDVVSGEFIHSEVIPTKLNDKELNEYHVIKGIQAFLDWDDSEETFRVEYVKSENGWAVEYPTTKYDKVTYDGVDYPVRTFKVEVIGHGYETSYVVAPESLLDAINKKEGDAYLDGNTEGSSVDSEIYHYVEDEVFNLSAKNICDKHLDIPMRLIEEII